MSYILDALRKADAQRERDPGRGIHAQPRPPESPAPRTAADLRPLRWGGAVLGLLAVGAALMYLVKPGSPQREPSPQGLAVATAPVVASPPAAVLAREVPAGAANPPAAVLLPPAPPAASLVRAASTRPPDDEDATATPAEPPLATGRRASTTKATNTTPPDGRATARPVPVAAGPAPGPAAPAPGAAGALPMVTAAVQPQPATALSVPRAAPAAPLQEPPAGLPPLVVTGGVYSANAANRMLIVNGQVYNEGAQPAPGVMLEEIRSGSAVLSFGGARFAVRY